MGRDGVPARTPLIDALEALRPEWEALWERDPRATPFQHPAWVIPHAARFAGGEIRVAAARGEAGDLVALLPLTAWDEGGTRRWVPLAAGHSDYLDLLVAPGRGGKLGLPRDTIFLPDLRPDSLLFDHPRAAPPEACKTCPVLARGEDGQFAIPYNMRRNRTKARNRAAALGGVTVGLAADPHEAFAALVTLSTARLDAQGIENTLADPQMQGWLTDALQGLAAADLLRFVEVRHEGRIVAALLGLADRHRHMSYLIGTDDSVPGQSFGVLAFAHLIDLAEARGDAAFHFLRGGEGYKFAWGAQPTQTVRLTLAAA